MYTKKSGIYVIKNTRNGRFYVGSSCDLRERKNTHFNELRQGKHRNKFLQRDYYKCNPEAFTFLVVLEVPREDLAVIEQTYLDRLYDKQQFCYNIAQKVDILEPFTHTPESRRKISQARKGKPMHPNCTLAQRQACNGKPLHPNTLKALRRKNVRGKSVCKLSTDGAVLETYLSARVASQQNPGSSYQHISQCCLGKRQTNGGFRWTFA